MQRLCDWVKGRSISVSYIYIYILISGHAMQFPDNPDKFLMVGNPTHSAHQLSNSQWGSYSWSCHHTIYCYHTPFSTRILSVWSQIFQIQFFPHIRPTTERTTIQYFKSDIIASLLYTKPASNASDLADQFSSTLISILDIHAPIKTKTVVQRPHTPWINPEILQAKRECSLLERCWRRWKSSFDCKKFRAQCNSIRSLISKAKSSFLSNRIIRQLSHILENPKHNSSKYLKLTSRVPRYIFSCQHIPWLFQR